MEWKRSDLDAIPRVGWVESATPVTALPDVAAELGIEAVGIKRDDLLAPLCGGTKPRKLDFLLATTPFSQAGAWHSMGAIGSGHLSALTAAARRLDRRLLAHCFWEPVSGNVLENLAFTASGPTRIAFYSSRGSLLASHPRLLMASGVDGFPVIPPGATCPAGTVGLVRAGLELAEQIRAGDTPQPDRLYVALGSGGTVAGLSVGLALGGIRTVIHAVAVVERPLAPAWRLTMLSNAVKNYLFDRGCAAARTVEPLPVVIDRNHLGPGYGHATNSALAACDRLEAAGIALEPVYTGKAMAALIADARGGHMGPVLFWHTAHRPGLAAAAGWQARLPGGLVRRLAGHL